MNRNMGNGGMGLPIFPAGISLENVRLREGPFFWEEIQKISSEMSLTPLVTDLLGQDEAPPVWVFLDAPERTVSRTVAVMGVARALHRRGKKVLILDGDDRQPDLSGWIGRLDDSGWVDFARYGASLQVCSVPLPWDAEGSFVMGVGSYSPAWLSAEEANALVERLRSLADVVLITAPVGEGGAPWAAVPSLRVVCWDRETLGESGVENLVRDVRLIGDRPQAMIAFGALDKAAGGAAPETADEAAAPSEGKTETVAAAASANRDAGTPSASPGKDASGGSSPFFRWLAVSLAVVVIAILGWWFLIAERADSPDFEPDLASQAAGTDRIALDSAAGSPAGEEPAIDASAGDESAADEPAADDSAADDSAAGESVAGTPAAGTADAVAAGEPEAEAQAQATGGAEVATEAPVPDRTNWDVEVGDLGWALHVYSLVDSTSALTEVAGMERRGVRGAIRPFVKDDGAVWYRVYAGSFPDRTAAKSAIAELKTMLGADWVNPVRFDR